MSEHFRLSPSGGPRWTVCPGSIREEAKYPEKPSGPAAIDGTHSHTLLNWCAVPFAMGLGALGDPKAMVGVKMKDDDGEFVVDAERANRVAVAIDYIADKLAQFPDLKLKSESRVNPVEVVGRDDMAGTLDLQLEYDDVLEIIDYKDGMHPVDPSTPQLRQYAIAVAPKSQAKRIRLTVIQPKLALKGMEPIRFEEWPIGFVNDWIEWFKERAAATDDPNAPLVPGEVQCKYCRAKPCSAMADQTMKQVGMFFKPMVEIAEQAANDDPTQMNNDQLRQIIEAAPLLRQLLESAEAEALRRQKSGVTIPGLKLVYGRGSTTWALKEEETAEVLRKMGVPKDAIYVTKLVSPAQAKKLVWEKRDGTKKQLTDRQLKTLETEYMVKLAGELKVAPESDSRPAVTFDASSLFTAVEAPKSVEPSVMEAIPSWLTGA